MTLEEQFEALDEEAVNTFVTERQEEHLHLEFKLVNGTDLSHRDDRKNFAKALSGYANSDGGIIVWGIKATRNDDGVDCACGTQEVDNARLLLTKLNEYTGQAVSPLVDGIRHKSIITADPSGYVVTLAPSSVAGPHMAKLGEDRYYKRSGDSFYKMEHFDIEDMFGRRRKPQLDLNVTLNRVRSFQGNIEVYLLVTIINNGRGSARSPFLAVHLEDGVRAGQYGVDGSGNHGLDQIHHGSSHQVLRFGANSNAVIHPGASLDVTRLQTTYGGHNPQVQDIDIRYELVAEDIALREGYASVSAEILQDFIAPHVSD